MNWIKCLAIVLMVNAVLEIIGIILFVISIRMNEELLELRRKDLCYKREHAEADELKATMKNIQKQNARTMKEQVTIKEMLEAINRRLRKEEM